MNKTQEHELIRELYAEQNYQCHVCKKSVNQRAHIIGNTKLNRSLYGDDVIDSKENWRGVCSLECNKKCDVGRGLLTEMVYQHIVSDIDYADKKLLIDDLIIEHREKGEAKIENRKTIQQ